MEPVAQGEVERLRRLARSSPWLWRSVRLTHYDGVLEPVRAWVRRPQALRVETLDGRLLHADPGPAAPDHVAVLYLGEWSEQVALVEPTAPAAAVWWTDPAAVVPARDGAGLVVDPPRLPPWVVVDDPMWQSYRWVAMLNPRELADTVDGAPAVEVDELAEGVRHGRATLWATVRPRDGYEPRCSCCPLLPCRQAVLAEGYGDPDGPFAEAHRVALDVATGICVSAREVGGPTPGRGFDVVLEGVDEPVPDGWFTPPRPPASWLRNARQGWTAAPAAPSVTPTGTPSRRRHR